MCGQVPEVYEDYTTSRVITMEYVPSTKISDVEKIEEMGLDRIKLAERSAISYLEQVLKLQRHHHHLLLLLLADAVVDGVGVGCF